MIKNLLIIDGSYLLHRAMHAPGLSELTTSSGIKSGGIYGFLRILQAEVKRNQSYYPVVCWDGGLSPRRTALYPNYKANRARVSADYMISHGINPENDYVQEYHRQRRELMVILSTLGITSLLIPKWEGDDLQYVLTKICENSIIVSDDKDMIQLVSPNIKIRRSMANETIDWNPEDTYYHHPRITIRKAIAGDKSDGIPNVADGLGEKTADKIAVLLENVPEDKYKDTLTSMLPTLPKGLSNKIQSLLDNWSVFEVNYQLINLQLNEIPDGFENLIIEAIKITASKINLLSTRVMLSQYQINTINPDEINSSIYHARENIIGN